MKKIRLLAASFILVIILIYTSLWVTWPGEGLEYHETQTIFQDDKGVIDVETYYARGEIHGIASYVVLIGWAYVFDFPI